MTWIYFMWQELFLLLQGVLCASHEVYFLSHKWFFILLCHKKYFLVSLRNYIFPVTQDVLPVTRFVPPLALDIHSMCINSIFFVTRTIFLVTENNFLMKFGLSFRCITFSWQMRGIYNQNFVWDLKISWEPGSQVPRDYPILLTTHPPTTTFLNQL